MEYIDLFAGIGGFRYGLDKLGFKCVFTSELDETPSEMYKLLHDEKEIQGDIMKIEARDIPNHDLLVGGFPCQGFSTNGTRLGFKYKTGNLFFEALRIAKEKKPKYVLMENVPGLLNHDKRRTISIMMKGLSDAGYSVDFTILTSTDFGLPQGRNRVFIVGAYNQDVEEWEKVGVKQLDDSKRKVKENFPDVKSFNFPFPVGNDKCSSLEKIVEKDIDNVQYLEFGDFLKDMGDDVYRIKDGTLKGYSEFKAIPFETTIDYTFTTSETRRGRYKHGITKTLDQSVDIALFDGNGFRRITAKEVFRLQGFPEGAYYMLKGAGFKESQLYKRPARSVSIPVIKALGEAIKEFDKRKVVKCKDCKHWLGEYEGFGTCENEIVSERKVYCGDSCTLGEK